MTYVWDTNILLHTVRNDQFYDTLDRQYHFSDVSNKLLISAVTVGEINSIAIRNHWGKTRIAKLHRRLREFTTVPVTDDPDFIQLYAEIDTYSQNQHPHLKMTASAVKMGKNDLWIAATTALFNATLISTDNDFNHLNHLFITFEKIIV